MEAYRFNFKELAYPSAIAKVGSALMFLAYRGESTGLAIGMAVDDDGFWLESEAADVRAGRPAYEVFRISHRDFAEYADIAIDILNLAEDIQRGDAPNLSFTDDFPQGDDWL